MLSNIPLGKQCWMVVIRSPTHLGFRYSRTMPFSQTGSRWVWLGPTASMAVTRLFCTALQTDLDKLWFPIQLFSPLVRQSLLLIMQNVKYSQNMNKEDTLQHYIYNTWPFSDYSDKPMWQTQWWVSANLPSESPYWQRRAGLPLQVSPRIRPSWWSPHLL